MSEDKLSLKIDGSQPGERNWFSIYAMIDAKGGFRLERTDGGPGAESSFGGDAEADLSVAESEKDRLLLYLVRELMTSQNMGFYQFKAWLEQQGIPCSSIL